MNIKDYESKCIQSIQELVEIKSVQDTPVEGGPFGLGNKKCLERALQIASNLGFKTVNLDGYCGYAEIGEGKEIVGIIGHLDVVPEGTGWIYPPYGAEIHDGKMYGRGTTDDKGPAICSLYALKALVDSGYTFKKRVRVIFGCNEESGSRCMEHYKKVEGNISYGISPDSAFPVIFGEKSITSFALEGSNKVNKENKLIYFDSGIVINAVPDTAKFTLEINKNKNQVLDSIKEKLEANKIKYEYEENNNQILFTVHGKACHGSIPQYGINAASYSILALRDVIENDFISFYSKYIGTEVNGKSLGTYASDEYGEIAVNIGIVHYENNNYKILVNSRLPFNLSIENQEKNLKETLKDSGTNIVFYGGSQGFLIDPNSDMIQYLIKAYQEVTRDYETKPICSAGGTYAREFNNCVAFGPEHPLITGNVAIHEPNEFIPVDSISKIIEIYYKAIYYLVDKVSF